jgi:hypothetical protein
MSLAARTRLPRRATGVAGGVLLLVGVACAPRDTNVPSDQYTDSVARLDSSTRSILPADLPPGVLGRCNRAFPGGEKTRWTIPPQLVQEVDARLGLLLDSVVATIDTAAVGRALVASDYYRQYAGVTVHGTRLIFVNGFHRELLNSRTGTTGADTLNWRVFPVSPCDAGALRFGVVYRVREQQLLRLQFGDSFTGSMRY